MISHGYYLALFTALYFVQGVITAYSSTFFKPHMNSVGISPERIAIVSSLSLVPFIIKPLYGILSDRVNLFGRGYRVPYMYVGIIGCAVLFCVAYLTDPIRNYPLLGVIVVAIVFFMALFDTAIDALAIDVMPVEQYERAQGFMTGGRAIGLILLSVIFGYIAERIGYQPLFLIVAVLLLFPLLMMFRVKEAPQKQTRQFNWSAFSVLGQPRYLMVCALLLIMWTTFQSIESIITLFFADQLNATESVLGNWGSIKGIGMVIGGFVIALLGKRFSLNMLLIVTTLSVSVMGVFMSVLNSLDGLLWLAVSWGVVVGFEWTLSGLIAMRYTDVRVAATMFAVFMTVSNIGTAIGEGLGTAFLPSMGYAGVFLWTAGLNLLVIPLAVFTFRLFASSSHANG
ncbi:MAG: MFS transporter [Phototrophicaceae bacterium]